MTTFDVVPVRLLTNRAKPEQSRATTHTGLHAPASLTRWIIPKSRCFVAGPAVHVKNVYQVLRHRLGTLRSPESRTKMTFTVFQALRHLCQCRRSVPRARSQALSVWGGRAWCINLRATNEALALIIIGENQQVGTLPRLTC